MANRPRSLSMSDAIRLSPALFRRSQSNATGHLATQIARAAEESRVHLDAFLTALPRLTEKDLIAINEADSSCPICLTPFTTIITEEEMAIAMDSPAHPVEELGVTRLMHTCRHVFCRKDIRNWLTQGRNSCPTCRQPLMPSMPGEDLGIPELFHMEREMSEHVRHIGGLLPLTDEQSEALGAAVILLAQGDTDSQLGPPAHYRGEYNDHSHDHGGMYS